MKSTRELVSALTWAAAILVAACLDLPTFYSLIVLPGLAITSLLADCTHSRCRRRTG